MQIVKMHKKIIGNMTLQTKMQKNIDINKNSNIFNLQDKCTRVQHDAARIVEGYLLDEAE